MNRTFAALVTTASVLLAAMAWAGTQYEIRCTNETCGFQATVGFGGGKGFEEATGFCVACGEFVSVFWDRGERGPEPVRIWDPAEGEILLYKCPKCGKPFLPFKDPHQMKNCPKCKQATLTFEERMLYD